ncbi:hypothetical protein CFP65_4704 [Kitasatospora sp. MMS16-BH015]|uniref:GNAT family N-acetyltransferase n=1 Tax=Kitasatospora sp. MMS16-BH015 TaxID=2018025 RepID=UPI000CA2808C|nr:GNAT family N-acetyltransferase [Kitasatospora sp. MMS16-BH015]AUG79430.1 hypothetical protein CFP65_4704 [Kitasatospora sp. MMS16-BH015]
MTWTLSASVADFEAEAGAFLRAHAAANTVLLTLLHTLRQDGPHAYGAAQPRFGWWRSEPGAPVGGAFVQTPPYPVRLGVMPSEAAVALARRLRADGVELRGVGGGAAPTRAFAEAWQAEPALRVRERLYRLAELTPPLPVPAGAARPATVADRELLVAWSEEFHEEIALAAPADHAARVDSQLGHGSVTLWEDGGEPVSYAVHSPVLGGMSRIGPVYTPKHLRGRGYASAATAAASAAAQQEGAEEVVLYTDLANPTSNSIYQKIGYRPVEDSLVYDFS